MGATSAAVSACASCGTELVPSMLACPACHALVHAERLRALAGEAERLAASGDLAGAKAAWTAAGGLLPHGSAQGVEVRARIDALDARIAEQAAANPAAAPPDPARPAWRRWIAPVVAAAVLVAGKAKFLLLGLSKASTLLSMLAYVGVYWRMFGWPLAVGIVVSIYIHEMGHVAALSRAGVPASAPLFVPGLGAFIRLERRITDPLVDAVVGLAGPLWGLGAAVVAWAAWRLTGLPVLAAIAHLGAVINLFNLTPVWQLDGAHGMEPLTRAQRAAVTAVTAGAWMLTHEKMLVLVGLVAVYQTMRAPQRAGSWKIVAYFAALVVALAALSTVRG